MQRENSSFLKCWLPSLFLLTSVSCSKKEESVPVPPASASVSRPIEEEIIEWDEYQGRLSSPKSATIFSRVSGLIESAPFQEGGTVNKGDLLFVIDPRPFAAEVFSKEADLKRSEAQVAQAETLFARYEKVKDTKAIAAEQYDEALAGIRSARAALASAQAALDVARLNLEWAKVTAPFSGRVSRKILSEGNLVAAGPTQALTTLTSVDPLYSYITIPERTFLRYQTSRSGSSYNPKTKAPICGVQLENEEQFSRRCVIDFVDNRVDPATGPVEIRGVVPNQDGKLVPGLFVRMRVATDYPYRALLVPDTAIGTQQNSRFALVVGADGIVQSRSVKVGRLFGTLRAIENGLTKSDLIIVQGIQQLKSGSLVSPKEVPIDSSSLNPFRPQQSDTISSSENPAGL